MAASVAAEPNMADSIETIAESAAPTATELAMASMTAVSPEAACLREHHRKQQVSEEGTTQQTTTAHR